MVIKSTLEMDIQRLLFYRIEMNAICLEKIRFNMPGLHITKLKKAQLNRRQLLNPDTF